MNAPSSRRSFLKQSTVATAGFYAASSRFAFGALSPNERLNIGFIGTAGQARFSLENLKQENIVALCDIDDQKLAAAKQQYPRAKTYNDCRRLVDQKDIDAIVVATPDHTHAVAALAALRSGRHLYCEKPMARTISEVRIITETALRMKRVTQLGTQVHAGANYRRVVELVRSGVIGSVRDVHVWVPAVYGDKPKPRSMPVPGHIHYDLWLGPVPAQPYSSDFVPFHWRNWWAFGGGALADFGCHYMDLPHWALDLRAPVRAEPNDGPPVDADAPPPQLVVRYEYPARGTQPPVTLTWYHGGRHPIFVRENLFPNWKAGVLFVGTKNMLVADYNRHKLLPEKEFDGFVPPPKTIPDSIGHHKEWVNAIKNGGPTTCDFQYSGPLTEAALLGNVAYRVQRRLEWDSGKMRATNCREAEQFIHHHYRKGWRI